MVWYSFEAPHQGTSNEYPQYIFLWRNKKILCGYPFYLGLCLLFASLSIHYVCYIFRLSVLLKVLQLMAMCSVILK